MYLKDILNGIKFMADGDIGDLNIKDVRDDSRAVNNGDLFIAVKGYRVDGHGFIDEAVRKGAKAILTEENFHSPPEVKKILVDNARLALPIIADNFYGHPSQKLKVAGVTGTNGKTTITYIIENILKTSGKKTGVIGTINYRIKEKESPSKNTTPGPLELQSMLAEMVRFSADFAIMEVSSHALDQHRVDSVLFDVGIFTNITREHLDYHRTVKNYLNAKRRLFEHMKTGGVAVLNNDDNKVAALKKSIRRKVVTYGIKKDADIKAEDIKLSLDRSCFNVVTTSGFFDVSTRLIGIHNVSNILASVAAAIVLGIEPEIIKKGIESVISVPGRLEGVDVGQRFNVFVDYAHTEDALYNILSLLRGVAKRRILTVFGCGGNRDRTKRSLMGNVACKFSDRVIVTSDNPRFEEPDKIIEDIRKGINGKFSNYDIVTDRRRAIEKALALAAAGDIVVIAGKGHENYQIIKDKVTPFDDREVVRDILLNGVRSDSKKDSKNNAREAIIRRSRCRDCTS